MELCGGSSHSPHGLLRAMVRGWGATRIAASAEPSACSKRTRYLILYCGDGVGGDGVGGDGVGVMV